MTHNEAKVTLEQELHLLALDLDRVTLGSADHRRIAKAWREAQIKLSRLGALDAT